MDPHRFIKKAYKKEVNFLHLEETLDKPVVILKFDLETSDFTNNYVLGIRARHESLQS